MAAPNGFVFPLQRTRISSSFGLRTHPIAGSVRHHAGIDLPAKEGTEVLSVFDGQVVFAGVYKGYGNLVVVRHAGGATTHYGHLEAILVEVGEDILAGAVLGRVGETGLATGPHLHFEFRIDGNAQNPEDYLADFNTPAKG